MSLIVENGSGMPDSESLCSVAQADAYHSARANASWALLTTLEKEAALRRSTDYLTVYRGKWKGRRVSSTQALDWPRYEVRLDDVGCGVYAPSNTVPAEVMKATAELAIRAAAGELAGDIERVVIEETIGPITTKYAPGGVPYVRYRAVDLLLAPLLCNVGGVRLVRG